MAYGGFNDAMDAMRYETRMSMGIANPKSHAKISGVTDGASISGNSGYRDPDPTLTASEWLQREIQKVTHRAYA